jgi:hypothetical protein
MMILPLILIVLLSVLVFYCVFVMIKRGHDLHALAFVVLYVYTIFAQIGYAYFPALSDLIGAYFGPQLFYKFWVFMFFSFFVSFLIYRKTNPLNDVKYLYRVKLTRLKYGQYTFLFIAILLFIALRLYFFINRDLFAWGTGNSMGSMWFALGFGIFTICTFFLYIMFRNKLNKFKIRIWSFIIFVFFIIFVLSVSMAAGTRSNILYFFIAIAFYELSPIIKAIKYQRKKVLLFLFTGVLMINVLMILLEIRDKSSDVKFSSFLSSDSESAGSPDTVLATKFLMQDYYAPSHLLFISMQYNIVDPVETFKSNLANTFINLNYPYLTQTITDKIGKGYDRGEGWGYHLFVEGYNAMGWLGIFYNAIFWNLGLAFWCTLARSDNKEHNKAMLSIFIFLIVAEMRSGQTCGFIRMYMMILLPSLALLLLATNSRIAILKKH